MLAVLKEPNKCFMAGIQLYVIFVSNCREHKFPSECTQRIPFETLKGDIGVYNPHIPLPRSISPRWVDLGEGSPLTNYTRQLEIEAGEL